MDGPSNRHDILSPSWTFTCPRATESTLSARPVLRRECAAWSDPDPVPHSWPPAATANREQRFSVRWLTVRHARTDCRNRVTATRHSARVQNAV